MSDERLTRGTVRVSHGSDKMRSLQVEMTGNEIRDKLEHFEPYGFSSEPYADGGTDALLGFFDDTRAHGAVIAVADRRYRITSMKTGEVAIFDDLGRQVYLKRDGILVEGADSPVTVHTSASVTIDAPTTTITGELIVQGHITGKAGLAVSGGEGAAVAGDVTADGISLKTHVHGGVQSGGSTTSTPQ